MSTAIYVARHSFIHLIELGHRGENTTAQGCNDIKRIRTAVLPSAQKDFDYLGASQTYNFLNQSISSKPETSNLFHWTCHATQLRATTRH